MATPNVYVICNNNCKYEGMTKEQILTAITQAVNEGHIGNVDTGFVSTVKTINGAPLRFFVGTQAEYDALTTEQKLNLFAIITNDTTKEGINKAIEELKADVESANKKIDNASKELENLKKECAKLSSTFTQTGTASTGYPIVEFDIGTILTYRVLYSSLISIGTIIEGGETGAITIYKTNSNCAFIKGSSIGDFALVTGKWRVCGMCGSTQINSQTYNYWIIQRVE